MNEDKKQDYEEANFSIRDQNGNEVLKIDKDGSIYWLVEGELVRAGTDAELGKAFALTILELAGMDYKKLTDVYLGESIRFLKEKLIEEVMKTAEKSKSIKKSDFLKSVNELKL